MQGALRLAQLQRAFTHEWWELKVCSDLLLGRCFLEMLNWIKKVKLIMSKQNLCLNVPDVSGRCFMNIFLKKNQLIWYLQKEIISRCYNKVMATNQSFSHMNIYIYRMEHDTPYIWCIYCQYVLLHILGRPITKQMMISVLHAAVWNDGWVQF